MRASAIFVAVLAASLAACSSEPAVEIGDPWVGTITTEGNVTTVINESGSVWGGTARLIEEASIGAAEGEEPYLLGLVEGIGVTEERLYLLDYQLSSVRVYDRSGHHLFDFGGEGQGPGEFHNPVVMSVSPDERLFVQDLARVNVFDHQGNILDTWHHPGGLILPIVSTVGGTVFVPATWTTDEGSYAAGLMAVARDGTAAERLAGPDYDFTPWGLVARGQGRTIWISVPFAPRPVWNVLPSGAMVEGRSESYRFEIHGLDGNVTVVERVVELVSVSSAEAEWHAENLTRVMRRREPGWRWSVQPIPAHKRTFEEFIGDWSGRLWVRRVVGTESVSECDGDPSTVEGRGARSCWRDIWGFDVFDEAAGQFLGSVDLPLGFRSWPPPVFLDDTVVAVVEDEDGTIMVKRYRLALPGEE